ncbi:hypothetical protein [Leisingera caerulea]|uniref:hypothetical protein n=1 Tax=Leisingera caerulea TaxID=506591 RepID=UPI00042757ED|nr:hypothetical protein [Leisingera caerulea]
MYESHMIDDLADLLLKEANKSRGRGLRISLPWLVNVLDGDGKLARHVLRRAGFSPDPATYSTGRRAAELGDFSYPPVLADNLTDVLDEYAPV